MANLNGNYRHDAYSDVYQGDPKCMKACTNVSSGKKSYPHKSEINRKEGKKPSLVSEEIKALRQLENEEQKFKIEMKRKIRQAVHEAKQLNNIPKMKFYVIHVNYFYSYKEDNALEAKYNPAEIALAEFSLADGITKFHNQIVNEKIRLGYSRLAEERREETHQIPCEYKEGKNDHRELFKDVYNFIKPGSIDGKLPPIYTLFDKEDIHRPAKDLLNKLSAADGRVENCFLLYSLEELFATIHNSTVEFTGENEIDFRVATVAIEKDPFASKDELACDYHCNLECGQEFCSLSIIKRWIFVLCAHCCTAFDIKLISGFHKPVKDDCIVDDDLQSIHSSFTSLYLSENRKVGSTISMTGVSNEHRELVSQRNYKDELRRREETKPIEIVDYRKSFKKAREPEEERLRTPFTRSTASSTVDDFSETESVSSRASSSTSFGRGAYVYQKFEQKKPGDYDRYW